MRRKIQRNEWTRAAVSNEYEAVSAFGNLAPSASLVIPKLARPELAYLWSSTTSLKSPSGVVLTKFIISLKFSSAYIHPYYIIYEQLINDHFLKE